MAIPFSDNFSIGVGNPIDAKYLNALNQPYADTGETNTRISESQRYIGLTVNIGNAEYWYKNGVTDADLILKTFSGGTGGGGTITGATNGLGVSGKNICLGGAISPSAVITDVTGVGIQYGADYSSTFINESLVTKRYVDLQNTTGTTFHIPVFNNAGNKLIDSTLIFSGTTLYNPNYFTVKALNGLYLVGVNGPANTVVTLGYPTMSTGYTVANICVAGQATCIALDISAKGTGQITLITPTSSVNLGTTGRCGLSFSPVNRTLTLPQSGTILGYGGDSLTPNAPANYIIGGHGYSQVGFAGCGGHLFICGGDATDGIGAQNCIGGDVVIESGLGTGTGARGNIIVCNLPAKTSEIDVLYYNSTSGKVSFGLASGGTGGGTITGATNGLSVGGLNVKLGGALCQTTTIVRGVGNLAGIEYGADYSADYSDRSLIDKGYANLINEKVSKLICQTSHGFVVKDVIGYSGGTYNKPIANGLYNGEILGIVTKCYNADCFDLTTTGYISQIPTGGTPSMFVANTTYFLSDTIAGQLSSVEPITLGYVSKAVIIADSAASGWVLPYAGYIISSGITESGTNTRRITQISHGFAVSDVVGWSGGTYNKAIANGKYNGEVIGIVNKVVNPNVFDLTQAGYISGLTGITMNSTYFLSDSIAGKLQTTKPTILEHVVRAVLVADTSASGWILPYPGYILTSGGTGSTGGGTITGATNIGTGTGIYDSTLNKNLQFRSFVGSGNTSISQVGNDIIIYSSGGTGGFTGYTFTQSGATIITQVGNNVNIYTNPTGMSYTFVGSGATVANNISGNTWIIYSPTGGTGGNTVGVRNISVNYTATINDDFIGVTGGTGVCVVLPLTPKPGQRITVADIYGNALSDNITICGNGRTIADAVCQVALINTNYGSMSFVNNNTGTSWSAVAWIN
jgi:hypothetical protein